MLLFRIHGERIRAGTMRMEESTAPLLKVAGDFVGGELDDVLGRLRVGAVVVEVERIWPVMGIGAGNRTLVSSR